MKLGKILFVVCVLAALGFLIIPQLGYANNVIINLAGPKAPETAQGRAEAERTVAEEGAKGPEGGTPLPSNAALVTTNIDLSEKIVNIGQDLTEVVTLADVVKANIPSDVQDPVGYALSLAVVGAVKITATGATYSIEESDMRPKTFGAEAVLRDPGAFAQTVDGLEEAGFDIAIVLSRTVEEKTAVEGLKEFRDRPDKVVAVLASNQFLTALLNAAVEAGPTGVSLETALESPAVVAARKGAV